MNRYACIFVVAIGMLLQACNPTPEKLPVFGVWKYVYAENAPGTIVDSIPFTVPAFTFVDQDSNVVDSTVYANKIFVTDFFFTHCPSICPKMKQQMLRVYEKYKTDDRIVILSFSIDPARDTVGKLHAYANKIGIETSKWHLLTGPKEKIYETANHFLVSAAEDPDAPGGHVHSGNFILVDSQRRLRGYYDGTKEASVDKLLQDMDILLNEK